MYNKKYKETDWQKFWIETEKVEVGEELNLFSSLFVTLLKKKTKCILCKMSAKK